MSSGARVVSAYAKQTDKELPITGWKILPNISNGLTVSTELTNSEMLSGGRVAKAGMVTSATVEGDIETELMFGAYDDFLEAAFWGEWQSQDDHQQLTIGTTKHQFAIAKDFTDINVNHVFGQCVVSSMSLDVDAESLIKLKFGFTGLDYQESKTTSFAKNPTPTQDTVKASGLSIGEIKVNGEKLDVCVEKFSFELDNQTEIQKCLGDNIYGGNILAMIANASGSMTVAYSAKAHEIVTNQMTGRTLSLEIPIKFGNNRYVVKIPKFQVSGEIPSPSGTDLVTVDLNYTVVDESPIIEKHTA